MPATAPDSPPHVAVVMGVSGSGKSTVAALVAERLGWAFADGDAFHPPGSIAKMQAGLPLDDEDRTPWLAALAAWIDDRLRDGECGVLVCSALKRSYRDVLIRGRPAVRIVYLEGSRELIAERLAARHGHFMPSGLLDSQFAILEPPGPDEGVLVVGIEAPPDILAARVAAHLSAPETRGLVT